MPLKSGRTKLYISLIILGALIFGILWYWNASSKNLGQIIIKDLPGDTAVFLNNRQEDRLGGPVNTLGFSRLDPGIHTVLLSHDGHWPWIKEVDVRAGEKVVLSPFFVPQNTSGFFISDEDPEYENIMAKFNAVSLPSFENKKLSPDKSIAIWVDESTLFAEWLLDEKDRPEYFCNEFGCHNVIVPLGVGGLIRNVDFYKGRSDVFIVSFGNGVFALEIDNRGTQNFQPIIEGNAPQFVPFDESSIYTLDNNVLMQVTI